MTGYTAPLADMRFVIQELGDLEAVQALPGHEEVSTDLVEAILEEAGRFAGEVLAPLNVPGDQEGAVIENGVVRMPAGFADAYRQFIESGWNSMPFPAEFGGQGLPWLVTTAVSEAWHAANMAFGLCPMLTQGASEMLLELGSEELKRIYLPHMVAGRWTGTMDLTEPQAGSDLARVRTRAVPQGDHYRVFGQKIFITYGDHDMAENIIHMVLARRPDAPPGVKGLSLFLVPKFLVGDNGRIEAANDVRCVSIEHKLGIKASPTAVLSFGDDTGAIGYLIGQENRGLEHMFLMMNHARLNVGLEGVGIAERAYQHARAFAFERVQGRETGGADAAPVTIIHHPDVQRMVLSMKARTEAARALAYCTAAQLDISLAHPDGARRQAADDFVGLMTPVVKAWSSEIGIAVADTAIQVHGGMGYIEESGSPQLLRDARIAAIYEGTNGIQANDLASRKVARDKGAAALAFIDMVRRCDDTLAASMSADIASIRGDLKNSADDLEAATRWIVETYPRDPRSVAAAAVYFLRLLGTVAGGWLLAKAAAVAEARLKSGEGDPRFMRNKIVTGRFYADHYLKRTVGMRHAVLNAGNALKEFEPDTLL